ncbi:hypothetical protein FRAHR75_80139 [Frankia sp. Hr75.2]|nr:hypothetical protein FRAHR75_80139 [Frankia sp. Hr75.2]SQD94322.1 hypothetical protein FMEAI12_2470005 [Parafrankia sp. Ea1.12]
MSRKPRVAHGDSPEVKLRAPSVLNAPLEPLRYGGLHLARSARAGSGKAATGPLAARYLRQGPSSHPVHPAV